MQRCMNCVCERVVIPKLCMTDLYVKECCVTDQASRLPHKSEVDVTKYHACHTKVKHVTKCHALATPAKRAASAQCLVDVTEWRSCDNVV